MQNFKLLIAALVITIASMAANADAIGYIKSKYDFDGTIISQDVFVEAVVQPADGGLAGAFYIGARRDGKDIAVFTPKGWEVWQGGLYIPIVVMHPLNMDILRLQILKDTKICEFAGQPGIIELWVGYGTLHPDREQSIQMMIQSGRKNFDPDHQRAAYIQNDMVRNNKYWNVINYRCPDNNSANI